MLYYKTSFKTGAKQHQQTIFYSLSTIPNQLSAPPTTLLPHLPISTIPLTSHLPHLANHHSPPTTMSTDHLPHNPTLSTTNTTPPNTHHY